MDTLYKNIKAARETLGLSQEQLAKKIGYTDRSSIAKIESGKVDLPQSKIVALAKALQTTTLALMGEDTSSHQPDELIAFYGEVKDKLDDDDKEDLIAFMRIKAQLKDKENKL